MLMPSIFGEDLFDDFFNEFPFYYDDKALKDTGRSRVAGKIIHLMKTDVRELSNGYELMIDMPGFAKEDIKAELEDGYLTISAEKGLDKDDQKEETGRTSVENDMQAPAAEASMWVTI